jgi:hypothetical protein
MQKKFQRGIDLLSECICPIKDVWKIDMESDSIQEDFMEDAKHYAQISALDTTKSKRITVIDIE